MRKIVPITDLQRKAGEIISNLAQSEEPVIITQRGRAAAVLLAATQYERVEEDLARLDELELLDMIARARSAVSSGDTIPHSEVKKKLARRQAAQTGRKRRAR
ncbi:MAG TPA: type II toxin-antitoxin system Phd/YefM family antitoxin [Blastocatellia bacterium]